MRVVTDPGTAAKRKFKRTHISRRDFEKAIRFIDVALTHAIHTEEYEALLLAAVVSYARPFSGTERAKPPPSDPRLAVEEKALLGADFPLHERLLEIRNKAIAHAESEYYPVELLPPVGSGGSGFATKSQSWHVLNEHLDLFAFRRIAEILHQKCLNNMFDIHFASKLRPKPGGVVTRGIQTRSGNVGYRNQLDRARRFLDRVQTNYEGLDDINEVEFQDMMWSFFQHCWHIKDWVRHDPLASDAQKKAVEDLVHQSGALLVCRDMCNGTKHLRLDHPSSGAGASHQYVDMNIVPGQGRFEIDCMIDDGHGTLISGKRLAKDCIAEWESILQSHGLATARLS